MMHRQRRAHSVAELYEADLHVADFPDNYFDTIPQIHIAQKIEDVIDSFQPTILYTHSIADLNRDHELVARAAVIAARPSPGSAVRTVLSFEVRSSSEWGIGQTFRPNWFNSLSDEAVSLKLKALGIYGSEMRKWPHARSVEAIEAQLKLRGSQVGVAAAEAFELIRCVWPDLARPVMTPMRTQGKAPSIDSSHTEG
jgi:LmbE family N-acetylglucosaminyl deacetylase